jgi:hypothetical protein
MVVHSISFAATWALIYGMPHFTKIATPPPLVSVFLSLLSMLYESMFILSVFSNFVSVINIMSTSCILRNTLSSNLPRMPFAFQVISFTYFSFGVNYIASFSENSIIISIRSNESRQCFNFEVNSRIIFIRFLISITSFNFLISDTKATLFRHHREVSRVRIPGRMASHGCCVVCVSCRPEKGELRRGEGGRGWPGKVPRSPAAPPKEKGKKLVDRKVPDRPIW